MDPQCLGAAAVYCTDVKWIQQMAVSVRPAWAPQQWHLQHCNTETFERCFVSADTMYRSRQMLPRRNRNTDENWTCDGSWFLSNVSWGAPIARHSNRQLIQPGTGGCVRYTGLMAEFVAENCGVSSPSGGGKSAQPGEEADGGAVSEVSVSNGDCGLCAPENQGLETANAAAVLDGKPGIPRKTSIIKVNHQCIGVLLICRLKPRPDTHALLSVGYIHPQVWGAYGCTEITVDMSVLFPPDHVFFWSVSWFHDGHQSDEVTCAPLHSFLVWSS